MLCGCVSMCVFCASVCVCDNRNWFQWFLFIQPLVSFVLAVTEVADLKHLNQTTTGTQTVSTLQMDVVKILKCSLINLMSIKLSSK